MTTQVHDELQMISKTIENAVTANKIYLFGSHAYGSPRADSDYDLCVVIPDGSVRPVDALKKIRKALYPLQNTPLDIVVYRDSSFTERQNMAYLERKIAREGVLLYERLA